MTTTVDSCRQINEACQKTNQHVNVTFNYRFNPVHELVKKTILDGEIGKVISVHFEWCEVIVFLHDAKLTFGLLRLLDTVHGAEYALASEAVYPRENNLPGFYGSFQLLQAMARRQGEFWRTHDPQGPSLRWGPFSILLRQLP